MSDNETLATSYLSPSTDSLWRWSGDSDVLTWTDGGTIAFRQEVEAVVERLAPHGLPPFGAVAMLLAACRDGWETSPGRDAFLRYANVFARWRSGAESGARLHASQLVFQRVAQGIKNVVDGLDAVSRLPPDVRQPKDTKAVLAETVFEASKNKRLSPEESALVVKALADGINPERLTLRFSSAEALREFADDADALREGLPLVSEQSLALRRRTGLDELPKEPDLDLAPSERVRRLLAELRDDKELAGLARLAQDLMAAVHVPRTLRQQEELPLGGVSDLSNRGPLDRLLVSELAHDDLTLAVRVAVNEALYLRRESPPRQPPNRRAIMIDAGIRTWGVPRVFGTAVALALAATADPSADLLVFRATPAGVEPVDLTTRRGLVAALEALEPAPHPGASLRAFFAAIAPQRDTGVPPVRATIGSAGSESSESTSNQHGRDARVTGDGFNTDAVLVTHPDVVADRDFAAALRRLDDPDLYVASVDRDGSFSLDVLTRAGRKPVREARLSLDAILGDGASGDAKPRAAGTALLVKDVDPDLPSILFVDPLPLRLPYVADPKLARVSQRHGLVAVASDGRLLHWDNARMAARQLTALLPAGRPRGIWVDDEGGRVHVLFDQTRGSRCRLITAELSTGRTTALPIQPTAAGPMSACARGGVLYLSFRRKGHLPSFDVEAFDLSSGAPIGTNNLGADLVRDRFFKGLRGGWNALAHDGHRPLLVDVSFPQGQDALAESPIIGLFDRAGHDGPWAVLADGRILDGAGKVFPRRFTRLPVRWKFVGVSADGNRIVLGAFENHLLDLSLDDDPKLIKADVAEELLVPQIYWSTRFSAVVRNKFEYPFIGLGGRLTLGTAKLEVFQFDVNDDGALILKDLGKVPAIATMTQFVPVTPPRGMRIELSAASWLDGSKAFLDSRGLLHLKSSDRSVPELSMVLTTDKVAGWSSEGKFFGPRQFIGDAPAAAPAEFARLLRRFISKLRLA